MGYYFVETTGREGGPLVFTFHGTGGTEQQFHALALELLPGAHVISPRGDVSEGGAWRFFRRTGEGVYDMDDLTVRRAAMAAFVAEHKARIGAAEVIGLGYSNGANILAAAMLDEPEIVDRAVLLHPLIPWKLSPQPGLVGRRVLITAGRRDPICPPALTQQLADGLAAQGVEVTQHWHPGGHEINQSELAAIQVFLAG